MNDIIEELNNKLNQSAYIIGVLYSMARINLERLSECDRPKSDATFSLLYGIEQQINDLFYKKEDEWWMRNKLNILHCMD